MVPLMQKNRQMIDGLGCFVRSFLPPFPPFFFFPSQQRKKKRIRQSANRYLRFLSAPCRTQRKTGSNPQQREREREKYFCLNKQNARKKKRDDNDDEEEEKTVLRARPPCVCRKEICHATRQIVDEGMKKPWGQAEEACLSFSYTQATH